MVGGPDVVGERMRIEGGWGGVNVGATQATEG